MPYDSDQADVLDTLDRRARRARPTTRVAVGAAVVLFIVAVAVSAVVSLSGSGSAGSGVFTGTGTGAGADAGVADDGARDRAGSSETHGAGVGASSDSESTGGRSAGGAADDPSGVFIHVLGAVDSPGLVELPEGARVVDAIAAAGGFASDADPTTVNLARAVADGEQLRVLAVGEAPEAPASGGGAGIGATGAAGIVRLNTADGASLETLPRIGPALAQRILDWREANGPFTSVDQLLDVSGIGDAVFSGLVERVAL